MTRYGVLRPDGSYTGGITDKHALAAEYVKTDGFGGRVYTVGSEEDPETKPKQPVNIWKAP